MFVSSVCSLQKQNGHGKQHKYYGRIIEIRRRAGAAVARYNARELSGKADVV